MVNILVLGAGGPAGVNFIKSLSCNLKQNINNKHTYKIFATDSNEMHLAFIMRYVDEVIKIPAANADNYIETILQIIKEKGIDFLYPQTDVEVEAIGVHYRKEIEASGVKFLLPHSDIITLCQDKLEFSCALGLNQGFSFSNPVSLNDIDFAMKKFGGPIWIRSKKGAGGKAAYLGTDLEASYYWIRFWQIHSKEPMIAQKYIKGRNIAWESIWYKGELITSQTRERIEYIYPHLNVAGITGTPAIAKTINDIDVDTACIDAIKKIHKYKNKDLEINGVFSVDLIKDENDKIYLTEINPGRFFTTSFFFSFASRHFDIPYANMPDLLIYLAEDKLDFYKNIYNLAFIPQTQILPRDLYWIRHMDIPHYLADQFPIKDGKIIEKKILSLF